MLKDILEQAWEAMLFNRRRTAITVVSMAWGIATVVLLLAYGAGFSRAVEVIFAEWGTNTIGVFPGRTTEQAGGDKAGVKVRLTLDDAGRVVAARGDREGARRVVERARSRGKRISEMARVELEQARLAVGDAGDERIHELDELGAGSLVALAVRGEPRADP